MGEGERRDRILDFLETIDAFKSVYRAAYLGTGDRHESDAEHTWHMAMFALLLYRETALDLDIGHVLQLILTHDLVEIYAGDTYVHLTEDRREAKQREMAAADQLFSILPHDLQAELHAWWAEFENGTTTEARFARAMDRLHGFSQNIFAGGRVWRERAVSQDMTREVNGEAMALDGAIAAVYEALYARGVRDGMWPAASGSEPTSGDVDD